MNDSNQLNKPTSGFKPTNWNLPPLENENTPPADSGQVPTDTSKGTQKGTQTTSTEVQELVIDDVPKDTLTEAVKDDNSHSATPTPTRYTTFSNLPKLPESTVNDPPAAEATLKKIVSPDPKKVLDDLFNSMTKDDFGITKKDRGTGQEIKKENETHAPSAFNYNNPTGDDQVDETNPIKTYQKAENVYFADLVGKLTPPAIDNEGDKDKLTFAHFLPEGAKNLSPKLKELLTDLEKQVSKGMANYDGYSSDRTKIPVDATDFTAQMSLLADKYLEDLIKGKIGDGTITEADARILRAMNSGLAGGTSQLKNLLLQLQGQVTQQLQAKFGFDVAYQPKGDVAFYNNVINGDFAQTYQKNLDKYRGKATASQRVLLEKFMLNPNDPSIPPDQLKEIKDLANQIAREKKLLLSGFPDGAKLPNNLTADERAFLIGEIKKLVDASKIEVIAKYGLDTTWSPSITSIYAEGVDPKTIAAANAGLNIAREILDKAKDIGNKMAEGPEKNKFLAYLQVISAALTALQDTIYAMQASQSNASRIQNRAKLDMQLNDLDKQQRAADKVAESTKKTRSMGVFGKIFDWIMKIAMLAVSVFFGPLAIAMAVAYVVSSAVSQAKGENSNIFKMMFDEIATKIAENIQPPEAAAGVAAAIKTILATVMSVIQVNPYMAFQLLGTESRIMQDIVKSVGGSKMAQELTAMIVNLVIQIVIMVVLIIVTGGAATPLIAEKVAGVMAQTAKTTTDVTKQIIQISRTIMSIIYSSIIISTSGVKINNSIQLSKIDIIKGDAEKYSEEIQAIIAVLRKMINKLLEMLQGNGEFLSSIAMLQGDKYTKASELTTALQG